MKKITTKAFGLGSVVIIAVAFAMSKALHPSCMTQCEQPIHFFRNCAPEKG